MWEDRTKRRTNARARLAVTLLLYFADVVLIFLAYYLALFIRFDFEFSNIPHRFNPLFFRTITFHILFSLVIYTFFGLYNRVWRYASQRELISCCAASFLASGLQLFAHVVGHHFDLYDRMPIGYYFIGTLLQVFFLLFSRFVWRVLHVLLLRNYRKNGIPIEPAMLVGGGSEIQMVLRVMSTTDMRNINIRCLIDDDEAKWGCYIENVIVYGGREKIPEAVKKFGIKKIFLAIPNATIQDRSAILDICKKTGCAIKILPAIYQLTDADASASNLSNVEIDDLLPREDIAVDNDEIAASLKGRVILVTGCGAIGTEICRQIASCQPARLIILDVYENNVYDLQQKLPREFPDLDMVFLIASVRDSRRLEQIFSLYRPEIVFHTAAHKHLTMMESSPCEALKNNVIGTYKTAFAAILYGCQRFFLLSSDKAVNPTSVLGASCRLNEILMQVFDYLMRSGQLDKLFSPYTHTHLHMLKPTTCQTHFAAIRFGNCLDSSGSSIYKMFQRQIALGGPLRITHKDVTRFCMSTKDAVRLILQASAYTQGGELFVLDMGTPQKIDDLARTLVKLNGLIPEVDIKIEYTGLRPGEKLYEEPLMWEEGMRKTPCQRIYIANSTRLNLDDFMASLKSLFQAVGENCDDIGERLESLVNSYHKAYSLDNVQAEMPDPINNLEQISNRFQIEGEVTAVIPMCKGYINHTYRVETVKSDGQVRKYTLQRINDEVFKNPQELMENVALVTEHMSKNYRLPWGGDRIANQQIIKAKDGQNYVSDMSGDWRLLTYFDSVHSYDIPESKEIFYYSGLAFGSFIKAMADLDSHRIHEVIPNFHNTWSRFQDLESAIAQNRFGRADGVQPEIAFVKDRQKYFKMISEPLQKGELPLRLGHNDCNLNNVLFDDETNLPVAIIDLDTVMPSSPLYDFGDSIRIGTNTAQDDEKDLDKVHCDLELYEQYAKGWLEACGQMLTPLERELLPYSSLVITMEDGIRFLMDHINGDTYYYTYYQGQNLDRARTQFKLVQDMEQKLPEIKAILNRLFQELNINK